MRYGITINATVLSSFCAIGIIIDTEMTDRRLDALRLFFDCSLRRRCRRKNDELRSINASPLRRVLKMRRDAPPPVSRDEKTRYLHRPNIVLPRLKSTRSTCNIVKCRTDNIIIYCNPVAGCEECDPNGSDEIKK